MTLKRRVPFSNKYLWSVWVFIFKYQSRNGDLLSIYPYLFIYLFDFQARFVYRPKDSASKSGKKYILLMKTQITRRYKIITWSRQYIAKVIKNNTFLNRGRTVVDASFLWHVLTCWNRWEWTLGMLSRVRMCGSQWRCIIWMNGSIISFNNCRF